ncbi:PKD domain-containing protein [Microbacterium sp. CJ88]|uniref:PKD domain-containing protein n=1 Tax=Microbacterium sp. CJ88 TaxID=3445672 RepID=UPI003F6554AA
MRGFWGLRAFVVVLVTFVLAVTAGVVWAPPAVAAGPAPQPCAGDQVFPSCIPADVGTSATTGAVTTGAPIELAKSPTYSQWEIPVFPRPAAYPNCAYGAFGYLYEVPCTETSLQAWYWYVPAEQTSWSKPMWDNGGSFRLEECRPGRCSGSAPYRVVLFSADPSTPLLFATGTNTYMSRSTPQEQATAYDVVGGPVGPAAPVAGFDVRNDTTTPGQIFVTSTSTPSPNELFTTWDFGDGGTGTGVFTGHVYAKPGAYTVTMTVRDQLGRTATTTRTATVAAPTLGVTVDLLGAAPPLAEDADVTARVTVSASADGVGPLGGLTFDGGSLLASAPAEAFTRTGDPTPAAPTATFTLEPGEKKEWTVPLHTARRGPYTLSSTVSGTDASSRPVTATGTSPGEIGQPFPVQVTFLDAQGDAITELHLDAKPDGTPIPQTVTVKTVVTNDTAAPLTGLEAQPVDLRAADPQHPYEPFPAAVDAPNDAVRLTDLAPGASLTTTRTMTASGDGAIVASQLIASDQGLAIGRGPLNVGLTAMLVMQLSGETQRSVTAGAPITIFGTLKNVTADRTLALTDAVKIARTGNLLGGGYLARTDGQNATGPFPAPLVGEIAPGQTVTFQVQLTSARPAPEEYEYGGWADDAYTTGVALFSFPLRAAVKEKDGTWSALTTAPVSTESRYPGSIRTKGDSSVSFTIDTARVSDTTAFQNTVVTGFGLSVGALENTKKRLDDLTTFASRFAMDSSYRSKEIADALDVLTTIAVTMPKADHDALVKEIAGQVTTSLTRFGGEVVGGFHQEAPTEGSIQAQLEAMTAKLQGAWGSGDPMRVIDAVRPTGNLIGAAATDALAQELALAGFVKLATTTRYLEPAFQTWRDNRTIAKMQANFPSAAQIALEKNAIEISKSKYPLLEKAYLTRSALTDADLGVGADLDGAGLAQQTIDKVREWTKANPNRSIVLIPNEANVAAARNLGEAVGKIENIKPKSMAEIEYLVFGGRAEDKNMVILRDLSGTSTSDANLLVDRAIARGDLVEEDCAVAQQILDKRKKEWALFTNRGAVKKVDGVYVPDVDPATGKIKADGLGIGNLKGYAEADRIPNQFRGVDNALEVSGPELAPKFGLDYFDAFHHPTTPDKGVYVVLKQEHPVTGKMVKITGDDDGIFIGQLNGLGLKSTEINDAYASLMDVFNHPFSDTWKASIEKKLEIFSRYFETIPGTQTKGAPLVMVVNGEAYAVKINGATTRFDIGANRAFIDFVGAPAAVDPFAARPSFAQVLLNQLEPYLLPAMFLKSLLSDPAAFHGQPITTTEGGKIVRLTLQGSVESWTLAGGWQPDPDAAALARSGKLRLAPQSLVTTTTSAGATRVELLSADQVAMAGDWFVPGDRVVIDPGGPHQETAVVSALGSLIFATGLTQPHTRGEVVASLGPVGAAVDPGTGGGPGGAGAGASGSGSGSTTATGGGGATTGAGSGAASASSGEGSLARTGGAPLPAGDLAAFAALLIALGAIVVLRGRRRVG